LHKPKATNYILIFFTKLEMDLLCDWPNVISVCWP